MNHEEELRAWAKGTYSYSAATELLIRAFGGAMAKPGNPWIHTDEARGEAWIDFEEIPNQLGGLSGGERRLLMIAASIAGNGVGVVLGDVLSGLDRHNLRLVLAAVAHAAGSHEDSSYLISADAGEYLGALSSLYPWPDEG